jgi:hypothetical protein
VAAFASTFTVISKTFMRYITTGFLLLFLFIGINVFGQKELSYSISNNKPDTLSKYFKKGDNESFQYYGRIENKDLSIPRLWPAGVYVKAKFYGTGCTLYLNFVPVYGGNQNYVEIVVDNYRPLRIQAKKFLNTISLKNLNNRTHTLTICKDSESGNSYMELKGMLCENLLAIPPKPQRRIEFIGNSITCGAGMDMSEIECGKGKWDDQANAYMSYGALTSRAFNAQWQLTSVSGIGLIHSCCDMDITMPKVFDKINMRYDSIAWDFNQYIPDIITICLGQNDGVQDSTKFCNAYIDFVKNVRRTYPYAKIILLSSPMADAALTSVLKNYLTSVVFYLKQNNEKNIYKYFFKTRYNHGCGDHPDLKEHQDISNELVHFIKENHFFSS